MNEQAIRAAAEGVDPNCVRQREQRSTQCDTRTMTSTGTPNPRIEAAECTDCGKHVAAVERGQVSYPETESAAVLLECRECGTAMLYERFYEIGDSGHYKDALGERLWPDPEHTLGVNIPESLRQEYEQARRCFNARAYTAAAVMVRRTLEGVCALNNVHETPLARALEKLRDVGLIDDRLYNWARALRVLGNDAAHFTGNPLNREDADDALTLAQALMEYMYVLSVKFQEFEARRRSPRSSSVDSDSRAAEVGDSPAS